MSQNIWSVITATGSYIPTKIVKNEDFLYHTFFDSDGKLFDKPNSYIIEKFEEITGIKERRYVTDDLVTSDIAYYAALDCLESSDIDKESLDYIIVAHNFGDVRADIRQSDFVPTLASRVKNKLEISNPYTIAYDLPFGCPGWLQGVIQGDFYIKSGMAKKVMVIGAETLSRVSDPHDRDSMIYSDGAGAVILEAKESEEPIGVLSHSSRSDTKNHAYLLWMGPSYNPALKGNQLFLKMSGHNLYKYALQNVPELVKECIDKANVSLEQIKKVFIHQANNKMDEEILKRFHKLFGIQTMTAREIFDIMPMTISWLGNSSVATLPTLLDLMVKGKLSEQEVRSKDVVVFASVGAGMNINSFTYKFE